MKCSTAPGDQIFVKVYGFLCFAKNIDINISDNLRSKYSQKLLVLPQKIAIDALKIALKGANQKTTNHLIGN